MSDSIFLSACGFLPCVKRKDSELFKSLKERKQSYEDLISRACYARLLHSELLKSLKERKQSYEDLISRACYARLLHSEMKLCKDFKFSCNSMKTCFQTLLLNMLLIL